ncbi:hypothetical protein KP509_37G060800 [Ceratopteris richardii]|uniref:RAVE complex protein Rav1 C-terminal domain-containing protein n=1 Tax=Ceratopteris richardii TaxID=49495 RepID=A0A8T2Q8C2_CERRI|nr:hypothetical protein KP509_37G060800 [Ceratopteris richardii]
MDSCSPNEVEKETNLLVKLISTTIIGQAESFTCVAFLPVRFVPHFDPQSDSMMYEPLIQSDAYDFATGSSNGVLSLWKKVGCESGSDPDYVKKDAWQSLESFRVSSGPLMMIAVGCSGLKIAIWTPSSLGTCGDGIVIWSIESIGAGAALCLSGRIALPGPIISMKLLDLGNGGSLLGVLQQSSLLVYTDSRTLGKGTEISVGIQNKGNGKLEQSSWQLLASVPFRGASCFAWGQRGSLLVSFKEHLLVFGLRFPEDAPRLNKQGFDFLFKSLKGQQCNLFGAGDMLYSPLPMYHPIAMLYYIYTGNYQRARLCLHHLQQNLLELSSNTQGNTVRGLLKIFSPAHLLEIYQKESQADKEPSKNRGNSMSWSIGHDRDLDDYTASFSGMNLSGKEFNKDLKSREANSSDMFSLEQLDLVLTTYQDVLDLTEEHKMQLLAIADMLIRINSVNKSSEYASLDRPGQRFWSAVQLFYSQGIQQRGKDVQVEDLCLDSKAMAWALQSECKDVLLDLCLGSEISWPAMRALGVGFWFTDVPQLRLRMEKLARAQYLKEKNPRHCALLYLALQRKNVLMGLLKLSKAEKDKVLYEFFGRDFSEEKNQAAALKNAYTLLGKHQHELAAAFFLLGGDLSSAVSACAKNLGDLQLALVICRLSEGINGPNEQRLAEYELFNAQREGDCWLASLLQLEALEYLHSAVSNVGKFATESGLSYLNTLKNNLALQFQAEVVMSHPCWWYGTRPMGFSRKDKGDIQKSIVDASTKLLQVLDALECDFCIDIKFIIAEVSRLLHYQNSWYLRSVFMRRISQGVHGSPELFSLPCLYHFIKPFEAELLKAVDPISLSISQLHKNETYHGNSVSTPQILYAMEVWLLHSLSGQNSETSIEAALLVLLLSSVAAWKVCDWVCIHEIAKLIKSKSIGSVSCLHIYDVEGVLLSFLESIHLMPILGCNVRGKICVNSNQMSEVEVWHVLSLVFWNAFYVWARQLVKSLSVEKLNEDASQLASHRSSLHKTYVTVLESITAIFERKLVYYLNTSKQVAFLSSWLSGSQSLSEICSSTSLVTSVNPTASERATDTFEQSKCFPGNFLMHDIWKDMLAPHNVRAILELAGARLVSSGGKACTPECLESSKINISEPIVKNEIIKGGLHDSEREFGTSNKEKSVGYVNANGSCGLSDKASLWDTAYGKAQYKMEEVFHSGGDLLEAISVNSCCRDQVVIASSRKGLLYFDINTGKGISHAEVNLWSQAEWPQDGWASSESTPMPTYVSPGVGIRGKEGPNLGLGGATVGAGMQNNMPKESSFKGAGVGIPGYGGMGALGLGWEEWEDFDGVIDPLATMENVNTQAITSHPLRPLFLVGSRNTHVYLWEFGKDSALATYGVLPAANVPPPYALASITSVRFDYSGHRFASSAIDGTVCKWQLEVGGRSNVHPTDSCVCFNRHASDVAFVGGSGSIIVATGASHNNENLVFWDTLAPTPTSQAFVFCHEGGARCLEMFDQDVGGGTFSPLIVTCGKSGDISVHDFRYIAKMKSKGTKNINKVQGLPHDYHSSRRQSDGEHNVNGSVWHISKAHSASITCVSAVPGTSLFFTGSKDGDIKLWDVKKCELVNHWQRVHDKQMFLQHNARGFGAVLQAAVTDIQPVSGGFLSCGGDGSLRLFSRQ